MCQVPDFFNLLKMLGFRNTFLYSSFRPTYCLIRDFKNNIIKNRMLFRFWQDDMQYKQSFCKFRQSDN